MKDILIVEDGHDERDRLASLFKKAGFTTVACEGVTEAEKALSLDRFRLAILDIGLNDRSGSVLFNQIRLSMSNAAVIIFTGNPSPHLKQRFIEGGAADYVVKGSSQAKNENFLKRVFDLLGAPQASTSEGGGHDFTVFLTEYLSEEAKRFFLDKDGEFPLCAKCGSRKYRISFDLETQIPPDIRGKILCASCSEPMESEIG